MANTPIHKQIDKLNNTDNTDGSKIVPTVHSQSDKDMLMKDLDTITRRAGKNPWGVSENDRYLMDQQVSRLESN